MSFAWEFTKYWLTPHIASWCGRSIFFFSRLYKIPIAQSQVGITFFFAGIYSQRRKSKKKEKKIFVLEHAKRRAYESSMIIANIYIDKVIMLTCVAYKWSRLQCFKCTILTFGLWFVHAWYVCVELRCAHTVVRRQVVKKRWRKRASVENSMNMHENFILMRASSQLVSHEQMHTSKPYTFCDYLCLSFHGSNNGSSGNLSWDSDVLRATSHSYLLRTSFAFSFSEHIKYIALSLFLFLFI